MKTFEFLLQNNDEETITNAMLVVEEMIFSEIVNIDAITKWAEIDNATKEGRKIEFIPYEKTRVPQMIIDDLNFEKAVKKKVEKMTELFFFEMELETFEYWVMPIEQLLFRASKMTI